MKNISRIVRQILLKEAYHKENLLMLQVPNKLKKKILEIGNSIDKSKLANEGLIKDTHITVLFGMNDEAKDRT